MDPNSANQTWSRWTAVAEVKFFPTHVTPMFEAEMKSACAKTYRVLFGSATEMLITRETILNPSPISRFTVECRTEGSPVQDPVFRERRMSELARFFGRNLKRYGKVHVHVDVHLEAGETGNGTPPSQLVIAPSLAQLLEQEKELTHGQRAL